MICQSCKDGADLYFKATRLLIDADLVSHPENKREVRRLRKQAEKKHSLCMNGSWCDCHHREPRKDPA
jgi:hypothetical protein